MSACFHIYPVIPTPKSSFSLIVTNIDFGLILYGEYEGELFSVDKFSLSQVKQNNEFPRINLTKKYLIRYNNNDGGSGNLNINLVQFIPEQKPVLIQRFNLNSIIGPGVRCHRRSTKYFLKRIYKKRYSYGFYLYKSVI